MALPAIHCEAGSSPFSQRLESVQQSFWLLKCLQTYYFPILLSFVLPWLVRSFGFFGVRVQWACWRCRREKKVVLSIYKPDKSDLQKQTQTASTVRSSLSIHRLDLLRVPNPQLENLSNHTDATRSHFGSHLEVL